jgi:phosphohistidine phosphatase SixA
MICLQEAAGAFPTETRLDLMPDGCPAQVDLWLRGLLAETGISDVLALVSHQPFLSDMVFHLTGRDADMKKASCTVVRWEDGLWRFERHYQPSELRA